LKQEIERWKLSQVIQHLAWFWAFLVLAATGLSFKYAHTEIGQFYVDFIVGGYENRMRIHRITAFVWIGTALFHGIYFSLIDRGPKEIIPRKKDLEDFVQHWNYLLGQSVEKPRFGRYTWYEKFEYWAGAAGFFVMASTGLLMWLKYDLTLKYLPLAAINVFRRIHGWEATLAVLFISVFHFYINIWRPGVFPMAGHWISGMLSIDKMREDHPLELDEGLKKKRKKKN
jgi:cytochrome b subunit of formate dehydrogenase